MYTYHLVYMADGEMRTIEVLAFTKEEAIESAGLLPGQVVEVSIYADF
jgi:hypothetical protein